MGSVGHEIQRPEVQTPSGAQEKFVFSRVKNVVLIHCWCAQPLRVFTYIRMIHTCVNLNKDSVVHVSGFGGLRKKEKTQHALVGLGSAALAAAVLVRRFPKGIIKCIKKQI